jgi:predicted alpha/beta-hydrolase family hydrolase
LRLLPIALTILLLSATLAVTKTFGLDEELKRIPTRPGVTQAFLLGTPSRDPVASVILFAGGDGQLGLTVGGMQRGSDNFLVRTRASFADRGFLVAVIDAPSDRGDRGLAQFRTSAAHAQDIAGVIAELRRLAGKPVWLVGTSMGTLSAANAAARIPQAAGGLVLTSSVTRRSKTNPDTLMDVDLVEIRLPTLFAHHKNDACKVTPYPDIAGVMWQLRRALKVELLGFNGGGIPRSAPCEALSAHGFLGIESEVVDAIAAWIRTVSRIE